MRPNIFLCFKILLVGCGKLCTSLVFFVVRFTPLRLFHMVLSAFLPFCNIFETYVFNKYAVLRLFLHHFWGQAPCFFDSNRKLSLIWSARTVQLTQ